MYPWILPHQVWKYFTWPEGDPNMCKVPLYLQEWLPHDLFIHRCLMVYKHLMHELAYTLHRVTLIDSKIVRRSLATVVPGWLQHVCQIINYFWKFNFSFQNIPKDSSFPFTIIFSLKIWNCDHFKKWFNLCRSCLEGTIVCLTLTSYCPHPVTLP